MNTTETTVTTKSIRTLAGEMLETRRKADEATKAADFLNKSLDAAPKTPKGKDTKATKAAREHVNNECAKANTAGLEAYEAFTGAIEKHASTYVAAVTSLHNVKGVLAELGYTYLEALTEQVRLIDKDVNEHNQKCERKDIVYHYGMGNRHYVFCKQDDIFVIVRARHDGISVSYVGSGPEQTRVGKTFLSGNNCIHSFNGFSHGTGTVNLSAIGDEDFDSAERRLKNTLEGIYVQRHIDKKIPIADIHDKYSFRIRHIREVDALASFILNEPTAHLGFKAVGGTKIEAVAFIPNADTDGIVYSTDANDA